MSAAPVGQSPAQPNGFGNLWGFTTWISKREIACLTRTMAGINSCDALFVMIAFPLGFAIGDLEMDDLLNWLLLLYTVIFCSLLLFFHLRVGSDTMLLKFRTYFGFMFSFSGRFSFLMFLALLCFSAVQVWWYTICMGIITLIVAIVNCVILCSHPAFASGGSMAAGAEFHAAGGRKASSGRMAQPKNHLDPTLPMGADAAAADVEIGVAAETTADSNPFGGATIDNATAPVAAAAAPAAAPVAEAPSAAAWDAAGATGGGTQVTALYKFEGDDEDPEQIAMEKGDVVTLIEKQADGWAQIIKDGKKGIVPNKYLSS